MKRILKVMILLVASLLVIQTAYASSYQRIDLGTLGGNYLDSHARGINNNVQIVGESQYKSGNHAFLWENGVMTDLGTLGGVTSGVLGINDMEQLVGASLNGSYHATLWTPPITYYVNGTHYQYCDWGQYPLINLFGEKDVSLLSSSDPIWESHANKLAKLVKDSDDKIILKTGEKVDLCKGYALEAKQVDADGKKVWLEFTKDGEYVDDQIVSTDGKDSTWTCELDKIQGEDNVSVLKVHVNQVFQGAVDSIAQIDGIWLIDYANATTLNVGDQIGNYQLETIYSGTGPYDLGYLVFEFN